DGKTIIISNGLTARVFRLTPNLATIDIINQMDGNGMLRAVSSEGELVINGTTWHLGGLDGQPERGYLKEEWIDNMVAKNKSFILKDFEISDSIETLQWARKRWALNKENPTGKSLVFTLQGVDEVKELTVKLHYDIYDHIPVIRKWMEIFNNGDKPQNLDSFKLEKLFFTEPESPVDGDPNTFLLPNIHIESDYHAKSAFTERDTDCIEHWVEDKEYTSQTNYPLQTRCTMEATYEIGPDYSITKERPFTSYKVYEMPMDSYDRERKGLFKRHFYKTIAPWTTENPIFMHLVSTDPEVVKRAVDQCQECGYEMIILSFGSGLNIEDISEENIARFKALVDYAHSKGIEMGCYSLLASRWISDEVDCINPETGKRGGMRYGSAPCLCSDWGEEYLNKIKTFIERTGMSCFEHDGSYAGDVCASTTHTHHKGLNDSHWNQFQRITELYNWMCANGVYINVPDFYLLNGSTKVAIGYREVNWSLPRERQIIHTRQLNYKCTWERVPSSLWSFVPLTQYHGGGAAAMLEPLKDHLYEYKTLMFQNYGAGVQACYRGPRLYDTEETKQVVQEIIGWYKKYREILNSDIIHLRQPDARDWDGIMHVNPQLEQKGLALFFNPTDEEITRTIKLPLYYTGLEKKAYISEHGNRSKVYKLNRDYTVDLKINIPANGYTWYVIE
ncbi:MAG: alpha-galactosidase, partial [Alistipes sp.]|nr:alpha-galactosidase [Alistipes sp.]